MGRSTRPPCHYHVHKRNQMCSWINGLQTGSSSPIEFLESPLRKSGETHTFVICTIMCNTLLQNASSSAGQCTSESEMELSSCPSQKYKETHSRITRGRGQQQSLFMWIQEKMKKKDRPYLPQPLPPSKEAPGSRTYLISWNSQSTNKELPQRLW